MVLSCMAETCRLHACVLYLFFFVYISLARPSELVWESKAKLPKPMRGAAIACNGKIYFMEANPKSSDVYVYDPNTTGWDDDSSMQQYPGCRNGPRRSL